MRVFLVISFSFLFLSTYAQRVKKWRFSPLPVIYYSPETKLGFGALVSANVRLGDSATSTSYLQTSFIYTTNKQYEINNQGRLYTNKNEYILQYRLYYAYFPEYFYGYQTQTPEDSKERIDYNRLWIELKGFKKITGHLYAGAFGRVQRIFNVNAIDDGIFETSAPPGYTGYTLAGIAPAINIDNRDNLVYPRTGYFVEASWMTYPDNISDFSFSNLQLDARWYKPVNFLRDDVVAFQLFLNVNKGNVPYRDMADIGGSNTMRGYYRGYYRYKNIFTAQSEYRFMINKYIGLALWGGCALVSEKWNDPFLHSLKPNSGIGLRVRINQTDKLNLRADYGVGRNQTGLYLDAAEAF
jgi:hypothetical protein